MTRSKKEPCTRCAIPCNSASGLCAPCYFATPARERSGTFGEFQLKPSHLITTKREPVLVDVPADVARSASITVAERVPASDVRDLLAMLGLAAVTS